MKNLIYLILIIIPNYLSFGQVIELSPNNQTNVSLPQLSYQQILNIQNPKQGSLVFDSTSRNVRMFNGTSWNFLNRTEKNTPEPIAAWQPRNDNGMSASCYAIDAQGNIYVAGYLFSTTYFDNGIIVSPNNGYAFFIAKYSPEGKALWVKSSVGFGSIQAIEIGTDSKINLLIQFNSNLTFDSFIFNGSSNSNLLIAKMNLNGNIEWSSVIYGQYVQVNGLSLDSQNNIFVFGQFNNNLTFSNSLDVLSLSIGNVAGFYIKYNANGNYEYSRKLQSSQGFSITDLEVEASGEYYLAASFSGNTTIGSTVTSLGETDLLILKSDNLGNILWFKREGGTQPEGNASIKIVNGNVFVMGNVTTPSTIGGYNFTSNLPPNFNYRVEMFWGLFNPNSQTWTYVSKSENGVVYNGGKFSTDFQNNFYLTGSYLSEIKFGNNIISALNNGDAYYVKGKMSTGEISYLSGYSSPTAGDVGIVFAPYKNNRNLLIGNYQTQTILGNFLMSAFSSGIFISILEE